MTSSPAWRPCRLLRLDRAVAVIWRCSASTSLAVMVSKARVPQAVAIRCQ
jgi:hypothetical protein